MPNNTVERDLFEMYSESFSKLPMRMTQKEAREAVRKGIQICKMQTKQEGTDNLPKNYGKILLKLAEKGNPNAKRIVETAKADGASDKDIRYYWNLNDLQRRMVIWSENVFRLKAFSSLTDDYRLTPDEAMKRVRKMFPFYGDPNDTRHVGGDDRPLPHEMRARVDIYREKYGAKSIKMNASNYSSYNAFVRAEIKKGNL